ncbi:hypothetical protein SAMN02746089_01601 [Caldanaerobius fijiensis DSM 17918]|uniref:Transglycosylase associated protein n=1 Tax=Caldanaerobius fijiensis DSM 17918 TaxID=1121256 RepID=A0A1M5AA07_9THEO|nr:hypothetical protein [Caldanaerobius fijiensis]SHF27133.1 hypothetical protein SAMN02746089_01601 [Caldanaerobius fijiensis DSM 17918]
MYWVVLIVVGLIVSLLFNPIFFKGKTFKYGGYWSVLIASLLGAWVGDAVLGNWGWMLASYNVIAGLIGSVVFNFVWDLIAQDKSSESTSTKA